MKWDTTRIKKKDALLNDHFSHLIFDFKLNVLHYWKAQFVSFENQKEKVLNLEAFGPSKKKSKNSQELFSQFHKRKRIQDNQCFTLMSYNFLTIWDTDLGLV